MGLVRNLCLVLTNEQVRLQLQLNGRQTAEQFKPVAIAERCVTAVSGVHRLVYACHPASQASCQCRRLQK